MKTLTILILLFAFPVFADDTIWGYVLDQNGKPVELIEIHVLVKRCGREDKLLTAWTGSDGRYFVGGLKHGFYKWYPVHETLEFKPKEVKIELKKEVL